LLASTPWGSAADGYLIFSAHALDQMRSRQIPSAAVYDVVGNPDDILARDD